MPPSAPRPHARHCTAFGHRVVRVVAERRQSGASTSALAISARDPRVNRHQALEIASLAAELIALKGKASSCGQFQGPILCRVLHQAREFHGGGFVGRHACEQPDCGTVKSGELYVVQVQAADPRVNELPP